MANPFVHVELMTSDVGKAKEFYSALFDWQLDNSSMPEYTLIGVGEGTGGGMMKNPAPGVPSHWLAYVQVDDVAASTEKARAIGATVAHGPAEIPHVGWYSVIIDPTGAALGLFQPGQQG